ncbi:MAG: hypothetical protein LBP98_00930 [Tannerella sp.]|jgi:hypothetical protein|nr:hypothetical protein [Tannerella sp.]
MIVKITGTQLAGIASAPKASSPQRRRRSSLWTALLFILCLTTFSANAASDKTQLGQQISNAIDTLNAYAHSLNGWDIPIGTKWASISAADNLQSVITTAQAVYDGPSQPNYDAQIIALGDAQIQFTNSLNASGLKYDYTALTAAIAAAEAAISPANFAVSADGMNVPGTKKWTSQSDLDAFKAKIAAARDTIYKYGEHGQSKAVALTNQGIINATAVTLNSQLLSFNALLTSGYMPDYSPLTAAIATAKNLLLTTAKSTNGSDVSSTVNWTTPSAWDELNSVVTAAQTFVDNNEGATVPILTTNQGNVTTRKDLLDAAVNTFNSGVGTGGGGPLLYNYLELNAAITDAQEALASITSDDAGNNVPSDKLWADPSYWNALNTLVLTQGSTLIGTYGDAAADATIKATNQGIIDGAAAALRSATTTLRANAHNGCKPDYTLLSDLISAAQADLDDTPASLDGHEYPSSDHWALPADRTALQDAINVAKNHVTNNDLAIHGNWSQNQNAVDAAYSVLGAAYSLFSTQLKAGDAYDPLDGSFTGLPALITSAEGKLDSNSDGTEDVVSSASLGADVPYGTYWLAVNNYTPLQTYLANARNIVATPGLFTKTYITNTYTSLSTAVTAANPQNGRGANPAELDDEIAAAELLKAALDDGSVATSSVNGTDVVYGTKWVTSAVATNLTTALTNAKNASTITPPQLHANAIVPLESVLQAATTAFTPILNPPYDAAPDMTMMTDTCAKLTAIVNAIAASANSGLDVLSSAMWVPAGAKAALLTAITAASSASYTTHGDVLDAIDNLNASLTALLATQAPGSKPSYIVATPLNLPNGFVGAVYNAQVVDATLLNVAFGVTVGALPDGLSLDASADGITPSGTGKLVGEPTKAGRFTFTIQATHTSMIPVVTETLSHTVQIYEAPAIETEYEILEPELVNIFSDIVIHFPFEMDTTVGTVTLNGRSQTKGYWSTDAKTFTFPSPIYDYDTNYTFAVVGFESKDGLLTYGRSYAFRTASAPPNPNIPRSVTLLPLPDDVTSDLLPGEHRTGVNNNYNFTFTLTVPPDKLPVVTTNRVLDGEIETVTGVPDPDMPETRFRFSVRQIHSAIEISVSLMARPSGNETVEDGVRIWAADGRLYVETPQPGLLSLYSVAGVIHARQTVVGNSAIPLPKGIYIVHLNGKIYKVAVL